MTAKEMGDFIVAHLWQKKIPQRDLANAIDVSASTLNSWIRRGRDIPARYVGPIAAFLQVSVNELLGLPPESGEAKCRPAPGVSIRPDGVHELDPCRYVQTEQYRNVTVQVLRCQVCGHVEVMWTRQENTEEM